jgi:hypothetical protein
MGILGDIYDAGANLLGGAKKVLLGGAAEDIDPSKSQWTDRDYLRTQYQSRAQQDMAAPMAGRTQLGQLGQIGQTRLGAAAQLDPAQQAQARALQMAHANRLGQIATGQMQGAGELAAQRQAAQAAAAQQAAARMARGMSAGSAQRGAARNLAGLGVSAAGQAQMAALQDQAAANQQLGSIYDSMRGADLSMAGQNANLSQQQMLQQGQMDQARAMQLGQFGQEQMLQQGQLDQQLALANADRQLQAMGMSEQQRLAYLNQLAQMNQSEMAGRLGQEQVALQQPGLLGPLLQSGGTILGGLAMKGK